ncbi:MAG: hypothetical protein SGI90_13915 [Candidatus Eisenbacteria bacterium]|nr:hypothetical protein [Candidatus Eisenbacteria bacterium]
MRQSGRSTQFALCLDSRRYRASLVARKVYKVLPDSDAESHGMLRVVDESGEDYLYSSRRFALLELPPALRQKLATAK